MVSGLSTRALLGRRVRAFRRLRDLTQEQLGEAAALSAKFVGMIERGVGNPSTQVSFALGDRVIVLAED